MGGQKGGLKIYLDHPFRFSENVGNAFFLAILIYFEWLEKQFFQAAFLYVTVGVFARTNIETVKYNVSNQSCTTKCSK